MENKFYLDKDIKNVTKFGYNGKIYEINHAKEIGTILSEQEEKDVLQKFMTAYDNNEVVIGEEYFKQEEIIEEPEQEEPTEEVVEEIEESSEQEQQEEQENEEEIENKKEYKENAKKGLGKKIAAIVLIGTLALSVVGCNKFMKNKNQDLKTMNGNVKEMDFEQLLSLLKEGHQQDSFKLMEEVQNYFNNTAAPSIKVKEDKDAQLYLNAEEIKALFTYANSDTYSKETFYEIFGQTFDDAKMTENYENAAKVLNNYYLRATEKSGLDKLFQGEHNQKLFNEFEQLVLNYNKKQTKENKQKIVNKLDEIFFSGKIDSLKETSPEAVSFIGTHMTAALELNGVLTKSFADKIVEANETVTCNTLKEYLIEIDEYTEANAVTINGEKLENDALIYIGEKMDNKNIKVESREIAPIIKGLNTKITTSSNSNKTTQKSTTKTTNKEITKKEAVKEFGKEEVKKAEQEADATEKIAAIGDKDYSIDEANKIEETKRDGYVKGYQFENNMYKDLYYGTLEQNFQLYLNQIENAINSYDGKYKSDYAKAVREGFKDAYNSAINRYNSEKELREQAAKQETVIEIETERYTPKEETTNNTVNNNTTNNNTTNDNTNNNTNTESTPKEETNIKTETVTPTEENGYTYEVTVERVYTR